MTTIPHHVYVGGRVQSLGVRTAEGPATVGVITPGRYTFTTGAEERVMILAGQLHVTLPGGDRRTVGKGETYVVAAHNSFEVMAEEDVAYICYYA